MAAIEVYILELKTVLNETDFSKIELLISKLEQCVDSEKTVFVCGNGGSASTASHFVVDFAKTSNKKLRIICLNDNVPTVTAIGNDIGYEYVFSEQLKVLGKPGDLLVVITGSGNSKNILTVVEEASKLKVNTFGLLGFEGGEVKNLLDDFFIVASSNYGVIEDIHLVVNHLITHYFKNN